MRFRAARRASAVKAALVRSMPLSCLRAREGRLDGACRGVATLAPCGVLPTTQEDMLQL